MLVKKFHVLLAMFLSVVLLFCHAQDKSTNATVHHLTQLSSTIQDNLLRYTGLASFSEG